MMQFVWTEWNIDVADGSAYPTGRLRADKMEEVLVDTRNDMEILGQQIFTGDHPGRHFGADKAKGVDAEVQAEDLFIPPTSLN